MKTHLFALPHQAGGGDAATVRGGGAADGNAGPTQTVPTPGDQSCFRFGLSVAGSADVRLLSGFSTQSQAKWRSAQEDEHSETAVFIEPSDGAVTRVRLRRGAAFVAVVTRITQVASNLAALPSLSLSLLQSRRGSPGWMRMLRVTFCSRQRTPLLLSLYLLTVHVLLLLCMGGYL